MPQKQACCTESFANHCNSPLCILICPFFVVYLETGSSTTSTTLSFEIASTGGGSWKIKTTQIECSSNARAPTDCVQYFTGISGEIRSFNFDGGIQLRDIQYTICVRRESGFCGIQYTVQDNTTPDSFDLSDATASANVSNSSQNVVKVQLKCSQNAAKIKSKCSQNPVKKQPKCSQNSV